MSVTLTVSTVKRLFALSMNVCAFQDPDSRRTCENAIATSNGATVNADICHIRGSRPDSARHDPTMSPEERDEFDNLILLCPTHHRQIDSVAVERFTVEVLINMKERSLNAADASAEWATDELVDWAARFFIAISVYLADLGPVPITPRPQNLTGTVNVTFSAEANLGIGSPRQDTLFESESVKNMEGIGSASDTSLDVDAVGRVQSRTDDIEEQRRMLRNARNEAVRRSAAFNSTTPLQPGQDAPLMPPEAQKAYEEVAATRKALEEFEKLHPRDI